MKYRVERRVLLDDKYFEIGQTVEVTDEGLAQRLTSRGTLVGVQAPQSKIAASEEVAAEAPAPKVKAKKSKK